MKITTTKQKGVTKIVFTENGTARFVERGTATQLEIPAGKGNAMTLRKARSTIRKAIRTAKSHKLQTIEIAFADTAWMGISTLGDAERAALVAENAVLAAFDFTEFKSKKEDEYPRTLVISGVSGAAVKKAISRAAILAEQVNACRRLANTPGGDMTPKKLAAAARKAAKGLPIRVSVWGKQALVREKMGAVLGVAQGSKAEPQFIIMRYDGGKKGDRPLVLVGKGVTFDTGGLNLKPGEGMLGMHHDMAGGAAVIHAIIAAAKLKLKRNIVVLVPAVENSPSGESFRPGDILKSRSGKTIEVMNTDAEGRLILADALDYAKKYKPSMVIDVATLTGASLIALGEHASAIFAPERALLEEIYQHGESSGDYVWPLPLWDELEQHVKGTFADVANLPPNWNSRYAGASIAAMFLKQFVPADTPWVHIDMAPRMLAGAHDQLGKGATGEPVRLLVRLAESR